MDNVEPRHLRASATFPALKNEGGWMQAQADVYSVIIKKLILDSGEKDPHPVADIGQSCDRGIATLTGMAWPLEPETESPLRQSQAQRSLNLSVSVLRLTVTQIGCLTTNGKWFDFKRGVFLTSAELFRVFGFPAVDLVDFGPSNTAHLLGNAMATPPLIVCFIPLLKHLGFLAESSGKTVTK